MALGNFKRSTTNNTAAKPQATVSRFAGIEMAGSREPMPHPGDYRFRVISAGEAPSKKNIQMFTARLEIVAMNDDNKNHKVGDVVFVMFLTSGDGMFSGLKRLKSMTYATLQMEGQSDDEISAACDAACDCSAANPLLGKEVYCTVRRGNDVLKDGAPTGDFYREYDWFAATA